MANPEVDRLVQELGSADFGTREAATKGLMNRKDAAEQLGAAAQSDDAEIRRRAETILKHREGRHLFLQFERIERIAAAGHYDLLVECCSIWGTKPGGERAWKTLEVTLTPLLFDTTQKKWFGPIEKPTLQVITTPIEKPLFQLPQNSRAIVRHPLKASSVRLSTVIVESETFAVTSPSRSLICSTRNLDLRNQGYSHCHHCVIFCDGDVVLDEISDTVVVASGSCKFNREGKPGTCVILDGRDRVRLPSEPDKAGKLGTFANQLAKQRMFFDTGEVGMRVREQGGEVFVAEVLSDSPFEQAGVKEGARIVALNDVPVRTESEVRKQLRQGTALGHARVTIEHGERRNTVAIDLMGWPREKRPAGDRP